MNSILQKIFAFLPDNSTKRITAKNVRDSFSQLSDRIDNVSVSIIGTITTNQNLSELDALIDGIYSAQTSGVYANGLIAKEGFVTTFRKTGSNWIIANETKISEGFNPFEESTLPSDSWFQDNIFNAGSDLNNIILDKKNVVKKGNRLVSFSVLTTNGGNVKVYRYTLDYVIIDTEIFTLQNAGLNEIAFQKTPYSEDYYVAIEGLTANVGIVWPKVGENEGCGYVQNNAFVYLGYKFGFSINVSINTLEKKFNSIGILEKSDFSNLKSALNKGNKVLLDNKVFEIPETLVIPSGTTIDGVFGRSIFKAESGFVGDILKVENAEDVKISNIVIQGNKVNYAYSMNGVDSGSNVINTLDEAISGLYRTLENGLVLNSSESIVLESLIFRNLGGIGIKGNHVGQNYTKGMKASKIFIKDCHTGLFAENEHEFSNYTEMMVTLCQIGQYLESGNLMTTNSMFTRSRIGILVNKGYNHAHGTTGMLEVKHHQIAGIAFNELTAGQYVPNIHMDYAKILIKNSKGISITGHLGHACSIESIGDLGGKNVVDVTTILGVSQNLTGSNTEFTQKYLG